MPHEFHGTSYIWFWSLRSLKFNTSNGLQIIIETSEIWLIEVRLKKCQCYFRIEFMSCSFLWFRLGLGPFLDSSFGNRIWCFFGMFWVFDSKKKTTKIIYHKIPWPWDSLLFLIFMFMFYDFYIIFIYDMCCIKWEFLVILMKIIFLEN